MSTTILSFQNRVVIETLHNEGRSLRYIANYLGFSKATIFNELHRLNSEYRAELAQTDFERKVSQRGRKSSLTKKLNRGKDSSPEVVPKKATAKVVATSGSKVDNNN